MAGQRVGSPAGGARFSERTAGHSYQIRPVKRGLRDGTRERVLSFDVQGKQGRYRPVMTIDRDTGQMELVPDTSDTSTWTAQQHEDWPEWDDV